MQVHCALDHVGRLGFFPINQNAIPLQQQLFKQVRLVVLHLDNLLREYLARRRARVVHVRVPQLQQRLSSEPPVADQKAVDDAAAVVLPARGFGRQDHFACYHGRVGFCDFPFFELARDYGADLVAQAEGYLGYDPGRDGGLEGVVFCCWEDWRVCLVKVFFLRSETSQGEKWTGGPTTAHLITKVAAVCFAIWSEELAPLNHGGGAGEGQLSVSSSDECGGVE